MRKKKLLYFTVSDLIGVYKDKFPGIVQMAVVSDTLEHFRRLLSVYIYQLSQSCRSGLPKKRSIKGLPLHSAAKRIHRMLSLEGNILRDIVTNEKIKCESVELLWRTLRNEDTDVSLDFLLDWYFLFEQLHMVNYATRSANYAENDRNRWLSGLDESVFYERCGNRTRMCQLLVEKIEYGKHVNSCYHFKEGMSFSEKQDAVRTWWFDYQFQLSMAICSIDELNCFMGKTLSRQTMKILCEAERKGTPFFVTPYYLSLLSVKAFGYDDFAIRSYILYSAELMQEFGRTRASKVPIEDPDDEGYNIHRCYPEVGLFIPDILGSACHDLCAVWQRMYGFQQGELNFDIEKLLHNHDWESRLHELMDYFEHDPQLWDVLLTGGDALMSSNLTLKKILDAILRMACRKKEANLHRKDDEKHATIQRVSLGSRMLAWLPYRINYELIEILSDFRNKAREIGITQFIFQTYFESPLEITVEVMEVVRKIQEAGWILINQQVFTVAASRRGHSAALRRMLNRGGILSYYTFSMKGSAENFALAVPNCRLMQEMKEEKVYGELSAEMEEILQKMAMLPQRIQYDLPRFLSIHQRPFVGTDRNMMNLPGIGKSLTFKTVGITSDGRRILCFTFGLNRSCDSAIGDIGEIYVTDNKSVASYLRQVEQLGERADDYHSVWYYNQGETEVTAKIFRYPK